MDKKLAILAQLSFYTTFGDRVPGPSAFGRWLLTLPEMQRESLLNHFCAGETDFFGDSLLVKLFEYYAEPWA